MPFLKLRTARPMSSPILGRRAVPNTSTTITRIRRILPTLSSIVSLAVPRTEPQSLQRVPSGAVDAYFTPAERLLFRSADAGPASCITLEKSVADALNAASNTAPPSVAPLLQNLTTAANEPSPPLTNTGMVSTWARDNAASKSQRAPLASAAGDPASPRRCHDA